MRSKFNNEKVVVSGIKFSSRAEGERWASLVLLQQAGHIRELMRQVRFELAPSVVINGRKKPALTYWADFQYVETRTGKTVVEDKKGVVTSVYVVKRHLMKSVHGIDIFET
ncbi:MAG: DUF1064 domain-containing protein [Janthinobacterium lividum]